jgi:cytochrome c551/c552
MRKLVFFLLLALAIGLVACGGSASEEADVPAGGDAAAGEALFTQPLIGTQAGCITCHSLEPGVTLVGPSLATIGADAGSRVSGVSAADYLRKSLLEPDADVTDGFSAGIMPKALAAELSEEQVNDLVTFMLAQK